MHQYYHYVLKNYYDVYTDAIEKVYKNLLPNVQNKVVYLLTTVDSESALKLYVDLVLKNYKNSDFIPISNLFERPYLYDYLFPKLYKALKFKNAKNNILILLNDYLAEGIVPVEDLKKNKKIICDALMRVFNIALKQTLKIQNIFKLKQIIDIMNENVNTNMDLTKLKAYVPSAVEFDADNIKTGMVPGTQKCVTEYQFM